MHWLDGVECIWINLDRSKDRAARMEQMFKDEVFNNIPISRFSAIDGKQPELIPRMVYKIHYPEKILEYACLLSHLESIRYFLEHTSYKNVLILEDDATLEFKQYWKTSVRKIMDNAPFGWDSILLGYMSNQLPTSLYTYNKYEGTNVKYWSTIAYVINRKGAEQYMASTPLINGKYHIHNHITPDADVYMWVYIRGYVYKYPMFIYSYQESSTLNHSTQFHNESKKRIEHMYLESIPTPHNAVYNTVIFTLICISGVILYGLFTRKNTIKHRK